MIAAIVITVLAFAWWKSAEFLLIHSWTRHLSATRRDLRVIRVMAVLGPIIAAVIWVAEWVSDYLDHSVGKKRPLDDVVLKPRRKS